MNIMVILKNIKRTEDNISADYYPEGKGLKGFMKMRLSDQKIIEHEMSGMAAAPHVLVLSVAAIKGLNIATSSFSIAVSKVRLFITYPPRSASIQSHCGRSSVSSCRRQCRYFLR